MTFNIIISLVGYVTWLLQYILWYNITKHTTIQRGDGMFELAYTNCTAIVHLFPWVDSIDTTINRKLNIRNRTGNNIYGYRYCGYFIWHQCKCINLCLTYPDRWYLVHQYNGEMSSAVLLIYKWLNETMHTWGIITRNEAICIYIDGNW